MTTKKPGVTELLNLLNKPALMNWANKIGLKGISLAKYRKEAMGRGSSLHKQIERYIKKQKDFEDFEIQKQFVRFMRNKEILSIEQYVENELFIGKYDIELKFNKKTYLCDWKSSNGVYLENILQLVAYRMVKNVDRIAIITIPEFIFEPIFIKDYNPYEQIIKSLSAIHVAKEEVKGLIKMYQIKNWQKKV